MVHTEITSNENDRIVSNKIVISNNLTRKDSNLNINNSKEGEEKKKKIMISMHAGMIHVWTHMLRVPLNRAIAQTLQEDTVVEYLDFKDLDENDINWVYEFKSITIQNTVVLRAVNAYVYIIYLSVNGDNKKAMDSTL